MQCKATSRYGLLVRLSDVTVAASDLPPYSPPEWKFSDALGEFTADQDTESGLRPRETSGATSPCKY